MIPGPQPLAPAQRHTEVRGGGAARRDLTQVPARAVAPPWARPHEGPPPPAAPGGLAARLSLAGHSVSGPLRPPRHPSPPPAIRARTSPQKGPHFTEDAEAGGWGAISPPHAPHSEPERRRRGSPAPAPGTPGPPAGPRRRALALSLPVGWSADAAGLGARRQAG